MCALYLLHIFADSAYIDESLVSCSCALTRAGSEKQGAGAPAFLFLKLLGLCLFALSSAVLIILYSDKQI